MVLSRRASEVIWDELLQIGAGAGLIPCGLGSRDSLRLEVCYPLNGADLSPTRTPLAAGLGIFVDLEKPAFIGRDALLRQKADGGPAERLAAFRMTDKSPPPRPHYAVYADGAPVGETTSGGLSPSLEAGIGLAYLPTKFAKAARPSRSTSEANATPPSPRKNRFINAATNALPRQATRYKNIPHPFFI